MFPLIYEKIYCQRKNFQMKNLNINETKKLINKSCQYFKFKNKNIKIPLTLTLILKKCGGFNYFSFNVIVVEFIYLYIYTNQITSNNGEINYKLKALILR